MQQLVVPDIGDFKELPVVEVLIKAGDIVEIEQPLIVLESDKAVMDVPSTQSCTIREVIIKAGDKVSKGSVIAHIEQTEPGSITQSPVIEPSPLQSPTSLDVDIEVQVPPAQPSAATERTAPPDNGQLTQPALAGPAVRKLARELGVNLDNISASGPNGRVLREDVLSFVKTERERIEMAPGKVGTVLNVLPWPQVDYRQYGEVERRSLSRIKRISAANLHRNWVTIPHVTNHSQASISELEAFRILLNKEAADGAPKITLLAFLIKACVAALKRFPQFNVSLDGEEVVQKHYFHIGFAADTPNGLVVPVIRNADCKGIAALAEEMAELSKLARTGKLSPAQMQGGCFSISSLGGIGGGHFTPIINAPEVAILGVGRSELQPRWDGKQFQPSLQLPLSLAWDHRAVDGAEAGRFLAYLVMLLEDFRRVTI
ncbi:2-oxo acid dehydrogenase subunit E2 [Pseudomonas sp. PGPR40]|uniref:2-oxo acid dehydrogenase subunit E2 n=1 Tax=Pseudomonas sp. PGPR40 TaxID=2913476 RepID=UPI001EDA7D1D|nr:2-oxo acid dehydrogenase subunit E2 [Pseudomonas sp. PGPR40]